MWPCTNISGTMWRNCVMAKSAARAACCPSLPMMPTPTWASWIIATSLPPSPMDNVVACSPLTSAVIAAFCDGVTRAQTTALDTMAAAKKRSRCSGFARMASSTAPPSTRSDMPSSPVTGRLSLELSFAVPLLPYPVAPVTTPEGLLPPAVPRLATKSSDNSDERSVGRCPRTRPSTPFTVAARPSSVAAARRARNRSRRRSSSGHGVKRARVSSHPLAVSFR
mmetsp:Transcript_1000/g.3349  ORF Transcript_1000/g.3349 Transcript_1000/m.3349 type:complete len:223 (+) Transcript_1000:316-984(+)